MMLDLVMQVLVLNGGARAATCIITMIVSTRRRQRKISNKFQAFPPPRSVLQLQDGCHMVHVPSTPARPPAATLKRRIGGESGIESSLESGARVYNSQTQRQTHRSTSSKSRTKSYATKTRTWFRSSSASESMRRLWWPGSCQPPLPTMSPALSLLWPVGLLPGQASSSRERIMRHPIQFFLVTIINPILAPLLEFHRIGTNASTAICYHLLTGLLQREILLLILARSGMLEGDLLGHRPRHLWYLTNWVVILHWSILFFLRSFFGGTSRTNTCTSTASKSTRTCTKILILVTTSSGCFLLQRGIMRLSCSQ